MVRKQLTIGLSTKGCTFTDVSCETGSRCSSLSLKLLMADFYINFLLVELGWVPPEKAKALFILECSYLLRRKCAFQSVVCVSAFSFPKPIHPAQWSCHCSCELEGLPACGHLLPIWRAKAFILSSCLFSSYNICSFSSARLGPFS